MKGGTPLINLEHKAELLNENKVSNQLRKSISGARSRLPVGQAGLEVESQDCQMRHVDLLQWTYYMLHVCRLHLAARTTSTNTNVPPTPLLFSTPIHNSLTRRSGPTPSLWNWNPTKFFAAARRPPRRLLTQPAALWLPPQRETFSFFGSELMKESQWRIKKKRKKEQSISSEPQALLLAAEAGRLPDHDSWCVCAPATV